MLAWTADSDTPETETEPPLPPLGSPGSLPALHVIVTTIRIVVTKYYTHVQYL